MFHIRIKFIFAALSILKEIEVHSQQLSGAEEDRGGLILPYWKRDPTPDARRNFATEAFVINPINAPPRNQSHRHSQPSNVYWYPYNKEQRNKLTTARSVTFPDDIKIRRAKAENAKLLSLRSTMDTRRSTKCRSTRIAAMQLMQDKPYVGEERGKGNPYDVLSDIAPLNPYDITNQISNILSEFEEAEFTTEIIGQTATYIDIVLFKISHKSSKYFRVRESKYVENEPKERKIFLIAHGLSPMGLGDLYSLTILSHLKMLLSYYLAHLDKFDIYFIPLANPDGYIQVRKNQYWNKNMSPNAACAGVDVDRNFDVAWNSSLEQLSSCSQHYPGPGPFSEPESRAVRDIFHRLSHKIVSYVHAHAGTFDMNTFKGDAVLYPKGYSDIQSDDDKYIDLKGEIDEAIKNANFKVMSVTVDTLYNWYGQVPGTSVDYASSVYGIPYAMEFVFQLYHLSYETDFKKNNKTGKLDLVSLEYLSLSEIWKRVVDVVFTNIHKKLEAANEAAKKR